MSQFSVPLGIITASVIAGAAYLNYVTPTPDKTAVNEVKSEAATPATVASGETSDSTASEPLPASDASANKNPPVKVARLESSAPARERIASAPPARSTPAPSVARSARAPTSAPVENPVATESTAPGPAPAPQPPVEQPEAATPPAPAATPATPAAEPATTSTATQ